MAPRQAKFQKFLAVIDRTINNPNGRRKMTKKYPKGYKKR